MFAGARIARKGKPAQWGLRNGDDELRAGAEIAHEGKPEGYFTE